MERSANIVALNDILALLARGGEADYIGEPVSQLEHALQCAALAEDAGAEDELVLAALLHDVGHLCAGEEAARMGGVGVVEHELVGARWLAERGVSEEVVELVRGHVDAKRYLVFAHADYRLSEASAITLSYQGGPMSEDEAAAFERRPLFRSCLRLRGWDEQAKDPHRVVAPLEAYRERLRRHVPR